MAVDIIARAMAAKANSGGGTQPDLSNYVQFDDYPSNEKAGVVKSHINGFQVSKNGNPNAAILSKEQYDTIENQYFISKGTLENIKDDYVESSTPVKNLNTSLIDITPKNNAEGTDNIFEDGLESPLYALGGDGKSEQVVTTGANLLNLDVDNNNQSYGGMTVIIDKDSQTVNFDGSLSDNPDGGFSSFNRQFPLKEPITVEAGSYDFFAKAISGSGTASGAEGRMRSIKLIDTDEKQYEIGSNKGSIEINKASFTFEQPVTITTIQIIIYSNMSLNNYKIGLYFGKQNVEYEPYTGGQPSPSPDYPQEINSIEGSLEFDCKGKNLLNNTLTSGTRNGITYTVNEDKSVTLNGTATTITWLILNNSITLSEGTYTMSQGNDNNNVRMFCNALNGYTQNGVRTATLTEEKTSDVSVNIPEGTTVSNLTIYPMIKESATLTEYEPYQSNQVTFNLNDEKLRSVGDVKDELVVDLDTGDYYKVENVGEVVFDGSENWIFDTITSNTNIRQFHLFLNDKNVLYDAMSNNIFVMSDYFKGVVWDSSWLKNNTITPYTDGVNRGFRLYSEKFEDVEQLKQWLSTHNTIVDYVLQTPTTKKLGTLLTEDLAKLKTFKGYNNVTVNTNLGLMNIRFTYGLDIKKYVDNKLAEISAQMIKGE